MGVWQAEGLRQRAGMTAGLWGEVVLGGLGVRVGLSVPLGGRGIASTRKGARGGQGWHWGREEGQLGGVLERRYGGRKRGRMGGDMRRRASQDRAVVADDGLDTGHSVNCPERGNGPERGHR